MESQTENTQKHILLVLLIILFIVILFLTNLMRETLVPIFFAFFTAMFLHPFIHKLHETRIPNWLSTLIVYLLFILLVGIILTIIGFSFGSFLADLPKMTKQFRTRLVELIEKFSNLEIVQYYLQDQKETVTKMLLDLTSQVLSIENFRTYVIGPVSVTLNILKGFGFYALALIFIIPGMDRISERIIKAFPDDRGPRINKMITNIKESIQSYMVAKSIISLCVGLLSFIICLFFGIKYALLWGVVIFLLNYIPYIGSIIAVMFPLFMCLVQYQSFARFSFLTISLTSVQVLMGNIIEPKFMSRGVNLSPLIIFTSLLVWSYVWGVAGVILSVPIMSAINLICGNIKSLRPISFLISAKSKKNKPQKNNKNNNDASVAQG